MTRFFRFLPLASALSGATGCLPIPHREVDAPELHGVVSQRGTVLAGAKVHRHLGWPENPCTGGDIATVDANGRFTFPVVEHQESFILFGDKFFAWEVAFEAPSGACVTWTSRDTWAPVTFECELGTPSKEPKKINGSPEDGDAGCSWH